MFEPKSLPYIKTDCKNASDTYVKDLVFSLIIEYGEYKVFFQSQYDYLNIWMRKPQK